jgi:hypothetical protein
MKLILLNEDKNEISFVINRLVSFCFKFLQFPYLYLPLLFEKGDVSKW